MHDSVINELGKFDSKLKIGEVQKMTFTKHDRGPFWLSPLECIKSKIELLVELQKKGVDTTSRRYLKEELIQLSDHNPLPCSSSSYRVAELS